MAGESIAMFCLSLLPESSGFCRQAGVVDRRIKMTLTRESSPSIVPAHSRRAPRLGDCPDGGRSWDRSRRFVIPDPPAERELSDEVGLVHDRRRLDCWPAWAARVSSHTPITPRDIRLPWWLLRPPRSRTTRSRQHRSFKPRNRWPRRWSIRRRNRQWLNRWCTKHPNRLACRAFPANKSGAFYLKRGVFAPLAPQPTHARAKAAFSLPAGYS